MATNEEAGQSGKKGGKRGINGCLVLILVLLLGAVIIYLLSVINSQRYYLFAKEGQLVIEQGLFLPIGSKAFVPADKALYEQYSPLTIPSGEVLPEKSTYSNLGELDRRLFVLLSSWAKKSMAAKEGKAYNNAIYYVDRARRLSGLSDDQQKELRELRAELAYIEGERLVRVAFDDLAKALKSFKLASELGGTRHSEAEKWILEIDKRLDAYRRLGKKHAPAAELSAFELPENMLPKEEENQPVDKDDKAVNSAIPSSPVVINDEQPNGIQEKTVEIKDQEEGTKPLTTLPEANNAPAEAEGKSATPYKEENENKVEDNISTVPDEELPRSPGSL